MKFNYKKIALYILLPLVLGAIVGFLSGSMNGYDNFIKPDFAPPGILFPIVWSILYILMGVSSYIISESPSYNVNDALNIYILQLSVNLLWSFIFFTFKWFLISYIWILLLIALVIIMIIKFYKINKVSGLLQIPYLLWITFASVLNLAIFLLNK